MSGPGQPDFFNQPLSEYLLEPKHRFHGPVRVWGYEDNEGWHGWLIEKDGEKRHKKTIWHKFRWELCVPPVYEKQVASK